ncbi:MAG: PIG-L family deacetylase [Nanoarchaeota archaeon]
MKTEKTTKKSDNDNKETIIVFGAHSDDFVIGAGGSIAEYVKEGKKVIAIALSFGEKSHPWLKEKIIKKTRLDETFEAGKILSCKVLFFNLREGHFYEDYQKKGIDQKLLDLLKKERPTKIFTHSQEDPHPDHKAVNNITLELL